MKTIKQAVAASVLAAFASLSQAAPIDVTEVLAADVFSDGADITLTFSGLDPAASGATFTFTVRGDLNGASENITVSVDGVSFGIWLDNVLANDSIDGPLNDVGIFDVPNVGTATLDFATFAPLVSDGTLVVTFDTSADVLGIIGGVGNTQARVQYISQVPEPGILALLGLGFAGLAATRKRKQ